MLPFGEYRPDVADYMGQHSQTLANVVPRIDGYGPMLSHVAYTEALPAANRGAFYARLADGSIQIFAGTSDRLWVLNNASQTWTPCSKTATVTISNASPAVVTYASHPFVAGDKVVFTTSGALPDPLIVGTVYYVISAGLGGGSFRISATSGGAAINTTTAGSGTHGITSTYSALSSNAQWEFVQFNNLVIAVQQNSLPQVYTLSSSTAFSNLSADSNMPQASYVSVVNRFLVLSGLASPNVYRIHWSGFNSLTGATSWTSGVNQCDYQDLPDGGIVRGVAGGEFGLIFQDTSIRRMTYAPGSPYIFSIDRIASDDGAMAPYSIVNAQDRTFFYSPQGFKMLLPGGYPTSIGKEKVDRTFAADLDTSNIQLMIGTVDPRLTRVYWAYKSVNGQASVFDRIIGYDWAIERWFILNVTGDYLSASARPGLTLEQVDAAYGSSIDALSLGSLDDISTAAYSQLAGFNSSHEMGFFSGDTMEATLVTSEHSGDGKRIFVRGFRPITDAGTIYGRTLWRNTLSASTTATDEVLVNSIGVCPQRVSARYARAKVRIPAATTWTFASGVEPDVVVEGVR